MKRVCVFELGPEAFMMSNHILTYYDDVFARPEALMLAEGLSLDCQCWSISDIDDYRDQVKDARVIIVCERKSEVTVDWAYGAGASEAVVSAVDPDPGSIAHGLMRAWARGHALPQEPSVEAAIDELRRSEYKDMPDAGLSDGKGGTHFDDDGRKGKQRGLPTTGPLAEAMQQAAEAFSGRRLECEALHLMAYRVGDHFLPHTDEYLPEEISDHGMPDRKVSISLELSGEGEYDGGCLRLFAAGGIHGTPKRPGWVTLFSSDVMHEVSAIGEGERKAVVGWYSHAP